MVEEVDGHELVSALHRASDRALLRNECCLDTYHALRLCCSCCCFLSPDWSGELPVTENAGPYHGKITSILVAYHLGIDEDVPAADVAMKELCFRIRSRLMMSLISC